MKKKRILCGILSAIMMLSLIPNNVFANTDKDKRTVYLHVQGENPTETVNTSTVYMNETTDIYFAVDNPNKGDYLNGVHEQPQYDMNGYTLRICYDPDFFEPANSLSPIDYEIPDFNFDTSGKDDENLGEDTGKDVPQTVGYFVYRHNSGTYKLGEKTYNTAYITVFYSGGYVPQKKDNQLWYNLAKLSLSPIKPGSTDVFIDIDSGDENYMLELFAKNNSSELEEQTFNYNAVNGGYHHILIKDKSKPTPPIADPTSGSYVENVTVSLSQEDNLDIYYTTDGSEPSTSNNKIKYTGPFDIDITTEIRTCAYRENDKKYSNSVSYKYEILPDRPYLFDNNKVLLPDIYSNNSKFNVYAADKSVFGNIEDGSEVYYTFSDVSADTPQIGNDPEKEWVKVIKQNPVIEINKKRKIRLITDKMGVFSEPATYYLSINPQMPIASHISGEYTTKIDVTLSCETEDATIYYTLDGTDPKTSLTKIEYKNIPITLLKDTTLRIISYYDGVWSIKNSYYYMFSFYDDYGVSAFYPPGVYEGSVNVTLTANNPDYKLKYHIGDGNWKDYTGMLVLDQDTDVTVKAISFNSDGSIKEEGSEHKFIYKIKPIAPAFAPESTQFTNADKITVYTPESTEDNTNRFELYYTTDGSDPITSSTRIKADALSDSATIDITKYTVVSAVVKKDGVSYSNVVTHSYDIVKLKPVKPITTLVPGNYSLGIGKEAYKTQFMPVPQGTKIYYTKCNNGELCPDPIPNIQGTYLYDGTEFIEITGNTVIKAIAVNVFGVKSDVGIFSYTITPEAPVAAPSAVIGGNRLPVVPVEAVEGSTVKYKIGNFQNEFQNLRDTRFYIDTQTGNAYRDKECTQILGNQNNVENSGKVTLEILAKLDGIESDTNLYVYEVTGNASELAPPYADKKTGIYEEIKLDNDNNLLKVMLYSLNNGGEIQYRVGNTGEWRRYIDGSGLLFSEDTVLQLRYSKNGNYSGVVSYVYNFVPLSPIIELPSGTYLKSDNKTTTISLDEDAPLNKNYSIWYRANGDGKDYMYTGQEKTIDHTMSFKAYVLNEDTGRLSKNTIHYYIIESGDARNGRVYIANPFDAKRISAHLLGGGEYAEGIKLLSDNKFADIYYYCVYTKKSNGEKVTINESLYDITRPVIPTELMDDITVYAYLKDADGKIEGSDGVFEIDFVHLNVPVTSLETTGLFEFSSGTKYTLINEYAGDSNIILYYTLDGTDPTDSDSNRFKYAGEELTLNKATTVRAVYFSACGSCKDVDVENCHNGVYGEVGTYRYTVPKTVTVGGGGGNGGGGNKVIDETRKYTVDIFGNEHPTHIGYIKGYPDGSVKPDGYVTREEITSILYRITNHDYEKPFVETGKVFPDVTLGRWSLRDIEYMADRNIVHGYPDGEFKPAQNLTRAEFASLIFRYTGIKESKSENKFTDLQKSHWAYEEILALADSGLVEGYEDKTYRPEDNITRAEVMTVINKIFGRKPFDSYVRSLKFNPYNDLSENKWYYVTVLEATITHDYWLDNKTEYEYKWENLK